MRLILQNPGSFQNENTYKKAKSHNDQCENTELPDIGDDSCILLLLSDFNFPSNPYGMMRLLESMMDKVMAEIMIMEIHELNPPRKDEYCDQSIVEMLWNQNRVELRIYFLSVKINLPPRQSGKINTVKIRR